LKKGILVLY